MKRPYLNFRFLIFAASIALGLILLISAPAAISPETAKTAALLSVVGSLWATGIIPEHITALLFFFCAMLFSVAPPEVIFSGFGTTAFWLVFGGQVIGVGITHTGLGSRIAAKVVVHLDGSYLRLISGLVVMGILFAFLMPSPIGRVLLLIPIALKIADYFGFREGSNGRMGTILAVILGTVFPAFAILPANSVNMILAGMSETQFRISLLYGNYLFLTFPVLGIIKAILIIVLIRVLYPDKPQKNKTKELITSGPMSAKEARLATIIGVLLALWMTDFIHQISPAWVSLGGAILIMLPGIQIVDSREFNANINYGSQFYLAGILGIGGIVSYSELGDFLADKIITVLPFTDGLPFLNYIVLGLASSLTGIVVTLPGIPAVMTPISDNLAQVTGLPLKTVIMTQVLGFSAVFFPYQIPSVVVGMQVAGEQLAAAAKIFFVLALITFLFLAPVNYLWWKICGWI